MEFDKLYESLLMENPYVELDNGIWFDLELEKCGKDWNNLVGKICDMMLKGENTDIKGTTINIVTKIDKKNFLNSLGRSSMFLNYIGAMGKTFPMFINDVINRYQSLVK